MDSLYNELEGNANMSSDSENIIENYFSNDLAVESEKCKNNSEGISTDFEGVNSGFTSIVSQSTNKEIINNQLIVLEPNNPVMERFQNALKQHLLKQRDNIKQELLTLVSIVYSLVNYLIKYKYLKLMLLGWSN